MPSNVGVTYEQQNKQQFFAQTSKCWVFPLIYNQWIVRNEDPWKIQQTVKGPASSRMGWPIVEEEPRFVFSLQIRIKIITSKFIDISAFVGPPITFSCCLWLFLTLTNLISNHRLGIFIGRGLRQHQVQAFK